MIVRIIGQPIDKPTLAGGESDAGFGVDALPPTQRRLCHDFRMPMYATHDERPSVARLNRRIAMISHRRHYSKECDFRTY